MVEIRVLFQFLVAFACVVLAVDFVSARTPWPPSVSAQAEKVLMSLSDVEKLSLLHGVSGPYVGQTPAVIAANILVPELHEEDGPQGVADNVLLQTQFPSALTVTSTWDPVLYEQFGTALAIEQVIKGTNVVLGPMVNLARVPVGGRNFESVGEDPFVGSVYAAHMIRGVQSQNVIGCVKHAFANNQEWDRTTVSAQVSERVLRELYYPAFGAAVNAGVASVMCSYNLINGVYACENSDTLQWLKQEAGFDGFVVSDWGAQHSTVSSAVSGLDQEMPDDTYFGSALSEALANGSVSWDRANDMALRILRAMAATNVLNMPATGNLSANATSAVHNDLARKLSESSTVLLKNADGFLPLRESDYVLGQRSIAVIGDEFTTAGSGSGYVIPQYQVTPMDGIGWRLLQVAGAPRRTVNCTFEQDVDFYQANNARVDANDPTSCCQACTDHPGCNFLTFSAPHDCWLKHTNDGRKSAPGLVSGACAPLPLNISYAAGASDMQAAIAIAAKADVTIVVVACSSGEGNDRSDLSLGGSQDELIGNLSTVSKSIVVVVRSPGAVLMPWADSGSVRAILWQGMSGQESGNALASVLFGGVNPSGRLPLSFPRTANDGWLQSASQYPGTLDSSGTRWAEYSEGLLMGYRWYTTKGIQPLFSFGFGLSYTQFQYSAPMLQVRTVTATMPSDVSTMTTNSHGLHFRILTSQVSSGKEITKEVEVARIGRQTQQQLLASFTLSNTGSYDGSDTPQLYLSYPDGAGEPVYVLRDFAKVNLIAGQSAVVEFRALTLDDVSIYDDSAKPPGWRIVSGTFTLSIGASIDRIYLQQTFQVQ